jgi:hypothetical protein
MDLDTGGWLVNFIDEDIPSMSEAEILHRLAALREIENARHFIYILPVQDEVREWVVHRDPETPNGYTYLHINWLMGELRRRGQFGRERT